MKLLEATPHRPALTVGVEAGVFAVCIALLGAFPARLLLTMREGDGVVHGLQRILAGTLLDAAAVVPSIAAVVVGMSLVLALLLRPLRRAGWQGLGPMILATPLAFATMVLSMIAQQVHAERGAFPTAFDILESANGSFVEGVLGFIGYRHVLVPTIVTAVLAIALFVVAFRRVVVLVRWPGWSLGVVVGAALATAPVLLGGRAVGALAAPLSPEALGEPLAGLIDSSLDLLRYGDKATPRQLLVDIELPQDKGALHARGAAQLGWPVKPLGVGAHPYARPLDHEREQRGSTTRGAQLLSSLQTLSSALYVDPPASARPPPPPPVIFHVLLEGFRADDLHALNPDAPRELAPFMNGLYARAGGGGTVGDTGGDDVVLVGRRMQQAGVRTAQGLGAMTCGLGTLPWNLSFIRDLQPLELRCTLDILHDAGASSSVWYGSDLKFDNMRRYLEAQRVTTIMSQAELPAGLPLGSWEAVADLAVVDAATAGVAAAIRREPLRPHHALVMTLSNHSPFTAPQDLPDVVKTRVEALYAQAPRAEEEDRRRLMTFSYTDFVIERLFTRIAELGLADRAVVVLTADHSTGHRYVWGEGRETDDAFGRIPFAIVFGAGVRARAADDDAVRAAMMRSQQLLDAGPLSLNDVPSLLLATLSASPMLQTLPHEKRWHTMGGQVTSPHFRAFADDAVIHGINGVSQVVAFNARGQRVGEAAPARFLQSSADRYRLTPALFPMAAPLHRLLHMSNPRTPPK
jgi:hypothetical protein